MLKSPVSLENKGFFTPFYQHLKVKKLLIKRRLSKVLSYLWREDVSIEDIISKCGFTNKSYFYKVFEEQFGVKPKFAREYWENFYTSVELNV